MPFLVRRRVYCASHRVRRRDNLIRILLKLWLLKAAALVFTRVSFFLLLQNVGTLKMAPSGVAWRSIDKSASEILQGRYGYLCS